jgi:PKD repeat protein
MERWRRASSIQKNPMHTYLAAGVYTVNLTVNNAVGTNSMLFTINVLTKTPKKISTIT